MTQELESPFIACKDADYDSVLCPFGCENAKIHQGMTSSTLVGWLGGPADNPNHHTMGCQCLSCGKHYYKHWVIRGKSAWYTEAQKVILGKPTCCTTSYTLPCPCGGDLQHSTGSAGGESWMSVEGKFVPGQPMYWSCIKCGILAPDHQHGRQYMDIPFTEKRALTQLQRGIDYKKVKGVTTDLSESALDVRYKDKHLHFTWTRERGITLHEGADVKHIGHKVYLLGNKYVFERLGADDSEF